MHRQSRPIRPLKRRRLIRFISVFVILGVLGYGAYRLQAMLPSGFLTQPDFEPSPSAPTLFSSTAPVRSGTIRLTNSAGEVLGTADRLRNEDGTAIVKVLCSGLPTIDPPFSSNYQVWMLKDGLADVIHVGSLDLRADGAWFLGFSLSPQTGFLDADRYGALVIVRQRLGDEDLPSRDEVARGHW